MVEPEYRVEGTKPDGSPLLVTGPERAPESGVKRRRWPAAVAAVAVLLAAVGGFAGGRRTAPEPSLNDLVLESVARGCLPGSVGLAGGTQLESRRDALDIEEYVKRTVSDQSGLVVRVMPVRQDSPLHEANPEARWVAAAVYYRCVEGAR